MTFSADFVVKKIEEAEDYLREIRELFKLSNRKIISESGNLHVAERLLQLIVDVMLDIISASYKRIKIRGSR